MTTHILKSWPKFFGPVSAGTRTHELRRNDRGFCVGDLLELHEYEPVKGEFTGRVCRVEITSLTSAGEPCAASVEALHPTFCILSVRIVDPVSS